MLNFLPQINTLPDLLARFTSIKFSIFHVTPRVSLDQGSFDFKDGTLSL